MSISTRSRRSIRARISIPVSLESDMLLIPTIYLFNVFWFSAWGQLDQFATKPWLLLPWLYGLAVLVPLVWREQAPVTVFLTQCVLTVAAWPLMPHYVPVVGVPVAVHAVALYRDEKTSWVALAVSFVPSLLAAGVAFRAPAGVTSGEVLEFIVDASFVCLATLASWAAGRLAQARRRHVRTLEAEQARLQRERETAREAVATERRRIARELHDIVSHAVTVIVLQAAGAARVAETDPTQVSQSLGHIQAMGTQAMAELRRLLGVLQVNDNADPSVGLGALGPQSGLADLGVLLDSLRTAGMPVALEIDGLAHDLDPSVDLAAYRIVQEGLTNVLKHAGKDSEPDLRLIWKPHSLQIQISNPVNRATAHHGQELSTGHGLLGLRERAHAAGGHLHAGPTPDGDGYQLTATLPIRDTLPTRDTVPSSSTVHVRAAARAGGQTVEGTEEGTSA